MPSPRRLKITGFIVILTFLIIVYIRNGAQDTYNSPFYTRTVEAINNRHSAADREAVVAGEKARLDRVARIQEEHDVAIAAGEGTKDTEDKAKVLAAGVENEKVKPVTEDVKETSVKDTAIDESLRDAIHGEGQKPVAGRKMMPDGKVVVNEKATDDGVAKVGNTGKKEGAVAKGDAEVSESEEEHKIEEELNAILKKGPVIIFSKSYCPFSKKAKHILLDLYTITPPPYVVELDQHDLGAGLQNALLKSTGRRTVPNVLVNGKSIGGGDDVEALHHSGELIEKISTMGGKRVMEVKAAVPKRDVPFTG